MLLCYFASYRSVSRDWDCVVLHWAGIETITLWERQKTVSPIIRSWISLHKAEEHNSSYFAHWTCDSGLENNVLLGNPKAVRYRMTKLKPNDLFEFYISLFPGARYSNTTYYRFEHRHCKTGRTWWTNTFWFILSSPFLHIYLCSRDQ